MSDASRSDEDPGASTTMFQRFVDEGGPELKPPAPDRTRNLALVGAGVILVGLVVIILVAVAAGS